jgi:hypothetical protein
MSNKQTKQQIPDGLEVQKLTRLPKGDRIALPQSLYLVKLPEYEQPVKIKEEYIEEIIAQIQRLKNT